jgi:homoserine O-succinyltransferase/O-acetyltransferase
MSIVLSPDLPGARVLRAEGVEVEAQDAPIALRDGPLLRVLLVNLMPTKVETEIQIARLLAGTRHRVALELAVPDGYVARTATPEHMQRHYRAFGELASRRYDGLVVTGAPVEHLPWEEVSYWRALTRILDWADEADTPGLYICWAAQAALHHRHGIEKQPLPAKRFGVLEQKSWQPRSLWLRGLPSRFPCPVSRHTTVRTEDLRARRLEVLAADAGDGDPGIVASPEGRSLYLFNHLEYDADTLAREYHRDLAAGRPVALPQDYFPEDDPSLRPAARWREHGRRLFANWVEAAAAARQWHALLRRTAWAPGGRPEGPRHPAMHGP